MEPWGIQILGFLYLLILEIDFSQFSFPLVL